VQARTEDAPFGVACERYVSARLPSLPLAASRCLSLPRAAPRCLPLPLAASRCLSLPLAASRCLSLPLAASRCLSLLLAASRCPALLCPTAVDGARGSRFGDEGTLYRPCSRLQASALCSTGVEVALGGKCRGLGTCLVRPRVGSKELEVLTRDAFDDRSGVAPPFHNRFHSPRHVAMSRVWI
jgi:hypothetical protein